MESLERKNNEIVLKFRELENKDKDNNLKQQASASEVDSKNRELQYL